MIILSIQKSLKYAKSIQCINSLQSDNDENSNGSLLYMIWESCHWKEPLLENRKYMQRFRCTDSTLESTLAKLEKIIFLGFYSIRKLIDAVKLSNTTVESSWPVKAYPNCDRIDLMNWHRIEEKYSFEKDVSLHKSLRWLCNQVIHSFVFVLDFDEKGKLFGIFVSSDRERNRYLYYVDRKTILTIFKLVGSDYPHDSKRIRDLNGDWITKQW